MNSLAGMAHALLGTQPLLVLRPTGPITAILQKLSALSDSFGLDFYCYLAAVRHPLSSLGLARAPPDYPDGPSLSCRRACSPPSATL